jgi:hypothetical protein
MNIPGARMLRSLQIVAILTLVGTSYAQAQTYTGPKNLGPFRIDKDVSMNSLFARLGRPSSTKADTFCYRSADLKAFLTVTRMSAVYDETIAASVTLSSSRTCINRTVQITPDELAAWKTDKGVGLTNTEEQVEKAYGTPSKVVSTDGADYGGVIYGNITSSDHPSGERPELGSKALIYQGAANDLSLAEFGIKDGRVVWISLSYNE